jgi:hypothetical protein
VLLDAMHSTWDTSPKEKTVPDHSLHTGHQTEKSV